MNLLSLLYSVFILSCLLFIYFVTKGAKERQTTVFNWTFVAFLAAGLICAYFNLYLLYINKSDIWAGTFDSLLLVLVIAYVISRYRMEEKVIIVRKSLVYAALTAIVSALYLSAIYIFNFFFKSYTGYGMIWVTLPLMLGLAIFFQPLKNRIQESIDKYFFKIKYEADEIRAKFTVGISKLMKIDDLAEYIDRVALWTFKLSGCAVYIFDEERGRYICRDARGTLAYQKGSEVAENGEMLSYVKKSGTVLVRSELESMMKDYKRGSNLFKSIFDEMKALNASILVPSLSNKKDYKLVSFLIADEKKSQDRFTQEDILLLETIANQAIVNIENAVLYQARLDAKKKTLQAERLSELGSAAARVARQARAALTPIINFSDQFSNRWNDNAFLDNAQEYLPFEVERLRLIMMGILEYSKDSKFKFSKIRLDSLIAEMFRLINFQARNKNVILGNSVPEGLEIDADKDRIKHVLLNLFVNSLEAMQYGGKLSVSAEKKDCNIIMNITDTGSGIGRDIIGKVFDPFFTTKPNAIGLGLAVAKKIVESHNGTIQVESETGKGTAVIIKLPA